MASGGGGEEGLAGKKRKAVDADMPPPARREPRRGLGVAALESIRAQLETVENIYVFPSFSTPPPPPTPTLPASMLVPGVRFSPYVCAWLICRFTRNFRIRIYAPCIDQDFREIFLTLLPIEN